MSDWKFESEGCRVYLVRSSGRREIICTVSKDDTGAWAKHIARCLETFDALQNHEITTDQMKALAKMVCENYNGGS
jgi:hypothetical protein